MTPREVADAATRAAQEWILATPWPHQVEEIDLTAAFLAGAAWALEVLSKETIQP